MAVFGDEDGIFSLSSEVAFLGVEISFVSWLLFVIVRFLCCDRFYCYHHAWLEADRFGFWMWSVVDIWWLMYSHSYTMTSEDFDDLESSCGHIFIDCFAIVIDRFAWLDELDCMIQAVFGGSDES